AAGLRAIRPTGAATGTAMRAVGARAAFAAGLAGRLELGLADGAVVVGVQPLEPGLGAPGVAGLDDGAHLVRSDRAVAVRIGGGQACDAGADELGLADALIAVGVGAHATR